MGYSSSAFNHVFIYILRRKVDTKKKNLSFPFLPCLHIRQDWNIIIKDDSLDVLGLKLKSSVMEVEPKLFKQSIQEKREVITEICNIGRNCWASDTGHILKVHNLWVTLMIIWL